MRARAHGSYIVHFGNAVSVTQEFAAGSHRWAFGLLTAGSQRWAFGLQPDLKTTAKGAMPDRQVNLQREYYNQVNVADDADITVAAMLLPQVSKPS